MSGEKKTGHLLLCQVGSPKSKTTNKSYSSPDIESSQKRAEQIAERRAQIPRAYKATYDRAVRGKSLRTAVNAQCLECCMWQRKEITLCTDLACSLFAVRPYQLPQTGHNGQFSSTESR